jgi:hypothetical protein
LINIKIKLRELIKIKSTLIEKLSKNDEQSQPQTWLVACPQVTKQTSKRNTVN